MISVTSLSVAAQSIIVELAKVPLDFGWSWTQLPEPATLLTISGPLNATFDGGISWEDAEWQ